MSEPTERPDDLSLTEPDNSSPAPSGFRRLFASRAGKISALAIVLVVVAGGSVWWATASASSRTTSGAARPGAQVVTGTTATTPTTVSLPPPPPGAPGAPAGVTVALQHDAVRLAWQHATGVTPVARYVVYRNGVKLATVTKGTGYQDTRATAGSRYSYQVQAVDSTGKGSALSPKVSVSLPGTAKSAAPPPPAMVAGWPTAASTGSSGSLMPVNGDVVLKQDGQTYSNMLITGTLSITACNVTIRNVEVDAGEPFTGDNTPDLFAIWLQQNESCGVTLDHVSVITRKAPNNYVTTSVRDARGAPVTITDSKMVGAQLGILGVSSGSVKDNYVELGANMRGDHNDALQVDGSSGLTIDHNTLLNPNDQTSALALYTEYGNNHNDVVKNNLMAGGGFTCYCGDGKSDNDGNPARAVNVSFLNNVFWRKYYPDAGHFGAGRAFNPAGGGQWVDNLYMNADGTLTTEQVPQPEIDQ
jgi:hypothetical protein